MPRHATKISAFLSCLNVPYDYRKAYECLCKDNRAMLTPNLPHFLGIECVV